MCSFLLQIFSSPIIKNEKAGEKAFEKKIFKRNLYSETSRFYERDFASFREKKGIVRQLLSDSDAPFKGDADQRKEREY
jgi:hypothetical protein